MRIGSILSGPIETVESALDVAIEARATMQETLLSTMEKAAKQDEVIKGYQHALTILKTEANKI